MSNLIIKHLTYCLVLLLRAMNLGFFKSLKYEILDIPLSRTFSPLPWKVKRADFACIT